MPKVDEREKAQARDRLIAGMKSKARREGPAPGDVRRVVNAISSSAGIDPDHYRSGKTGDQIVDMCLGAKRTGAARWAIWLCKAPKTIDVGSLLLRSTTKSGNPAAPLAYLEKELGKAEEVYMANGYAPEEPVVAFRHGDSGMLIYGHVSEAPEGAELAGINCAMFDLGTSGALAGLRYLMSLPDYLGAAK